MAKAKPFIKWVGGKGQLIEQLEELLPADFDEWEDVTYIEPFVGGGAMMFYMLQRYPNIKKAVINDINEDLISCYKVVRDKPLLLIESLKEIQNEYFSLETEKEKKECFLRKREIYNTEILDDLQRSTLLIFLNRTCFNGLFRVNKAGLFNVPFGRNMFPTICNPETILRDSQILKRVNILTGDFQDTLKFAKGKTFFYFDPPYRPLSNTSSFNDYSKEAFNDKAQIRLKEFCDKINDLGHHFMLSNADCFSKGGDRFFEDLYKGYFFERVYASRMVNANASKRGKLTEILVHNYESTKKLSYKFQFAL